MSLGKSSIKRIAVIENSLTLSKTEEEDEDVSVNSDKKITDSNKNETQSSLYINDKLTARGIILMVALAATIFAGCTSYSLIAPFFPRVAVSKGLNISEYSFVFAIYEVVSFILPPFCSVMAMRMTPKIFLMTSLFITAFSATIFGFLILAKSSNFFALCIIVRIFWSIGGAGATTGVYLCGAILFPNHIPQVYAAIEIGAGFGFMAGPFIGGILYEWGGFPVPFCVTACFCLLSIIPIGILIKDEIKPKDENKNEKPEFFFETIKVPGVCINLLISAVTCYGMGFSESALDHHLTEIGQFSPSQVGRVFLISGLLYSIFTYIFGTIAKKWPKNCYNLIFIGLVLLIFSFIIVGPIPYLPFGPNIYLVIVSQICSGVAMGALFVLSFDDCVKEAKKNLPNNDATMAKISGFYTSSYALGTALGPSIGGQLVSRFGYRSATVPICFTIAILFVLVAYYVFRIKRKSRNLPDIVQTSIRTIN